VSDNWQNQFAWRAPVPSEEERRLRRSSIRPTGEQRQIRFWAIPINSEGWRVCLEAGVDFINTDNLDGLSRFLVRARCEINDCGPGLVRPEALAT
jgi:hypothetical protein